MHDDFYIGYLKKAPEALAKFVRRALIVVIAAVLGAAVLAVLGQQRLPEGRFDYGNKTEVRGAVLLDAVPRIIVDSANSGAMQPGAVAVLVGEGKHGFNGRPPGSGPFSAALHGSLITNGKTLMLEVQEISETSTAAPQPAPDPQFDTGDVQTIEGELVDTKCFLGVMRPGQGKVHRGCAIACLEGGVPAGLWITSGEGREGRLVFIANDDAYRSVIPPHWAGLKVQITGRRTRLDGVDTIYLQEAHVLD